MAHQETHEENLTHEEIKYRYHIQRGYDFTRIELFLSARENYQLALNYKPGDPFATGKIDDCNRMIAGDRKKVLIIVPFVLALIAGIILLNL